MIFPPKLLVCIYYIIGEKGFQRKKKKVETFF